MSPQLINVLEAAISRLESWKGGVVQVEESISRLADEGVWSYERHFCTFSQFSMTVESVGWFFSGSSIDVGGSQGGRPAFYQLTTDRIIEIDLSACAIVTFKERFGEVAEHRSSFRIASGVPVADTPE